MNKILSRLILFLFFLALVFYWLFLSSATSFEGKSAFIIIAENKKDKTSILHELKAKGIIGDTFTFSFLATGMGVWDKVKPGKYEIKKGQSLLTISRILKNGRLAEIKLVINRLRTKEDLAKLIGKNFSTDSTAVMKYLSSNDSLKGLGVDTNRLFTLIIPDTYAFYWNTPLRKILRKLADTKNTFWQNQGRLEKAKAIKLSPEEVYTLASIVEEETNYDSDKIKIASVYINRLNKSMPLQACPTIKFAMRDFSITRIYEKYLFNPSPYNTYRKTGLPPGPICTPAAKTIDLVLNAPRTDYLFFVAKSDFSGYHHFSNSYTEHNKYAQEYQKVLDIYMTKKTK
ncbi:MAG: endolytic transglycosylase MltG [Chitinophagaceae bacterium]|nr:endolytic transglycosylase MltG [Chitinophagaceae bacterium]MDP3667676.1 endolytic transglycosylase MltG [Sediminibacterium sp.]